MRGDPSGKDAAPRRDARPREDRAAADVEGGALLDVDLPPSARAYWFVPIIKGQSEPVRLERGATIRDVSWWYA